jgi:thiol-disulfide isomerase/thioredoxin
MLERLVVVLVLLILVVVVSLAVRSVARRRVAAAKGQVLPDGLRARLSGHAPGIVYFYGPHCATCRQQVKILDQLADDDGVAVVRVDATREPDLADALAVATVPTTVTVDDRGAVRAINLGFRSRDELAAQLSEPANLPVHPTLS